MSIATLEKVDELKRMNMKVHAMNDNLASYEWMRKGIPLACNEKTYIRIAHDEERYLSVRKLFMTIYTLRAM